MEIVEVVLVPDVCWLLLAQDSPEIVLVKLSSGLRLEPLVGRQGAPSDELTVDCLPCDLSE